MNIFSIKEILFNFFLKIPLAMKLIILILILLVSVSRAENTNAQNTKISINAQNQTIAEILETVEQQTDFSFIYDSKLVDTERKVSVQADDENIFDVLTQMFVGSDIAYTVVNKKIILNKSEEILNPSQSNIIVYGIVTSSSGESLPGVSIAVKGTSIGAVSNLDGKYSLTVPSEEAVLVFSYIGFTTQEITVGQQKNINITMREATGEIDEVVVVGYGTQKKADLTGAVSTVSIPNMEKRTIAQTSLALTGLIPGVVVTQRSGKPGGDAGIISVRGKTTLGNNDVLVLIDGVESNINIIDPKSIESISVLKDAASAAIYGNRAANGVILITTKRAEDGKAYVSYNGYVAQGKPTNVPKYVNAVDFMKYISIAKRAVGITPEYSDEYIQEYEEGVKRGDPNYPDVDWFKATATNNGIINSHFITVSLGKKELKSLVQGGYLHQNGITENTNFERYTLRSNTDFEMSKKFELHSDLALVYSTSKEPSKLGLGYNFVGRIPANQPAYLPDGRYGPGWQGINPVAYYKDGGPIIVNAPSGIFNFSGAFRPVKFLELNGQYSVNYWEEHFSNYDKRVQLYLKDGTPDPQTQAKSTLSNGTTRDMRTMLNGDATLTQSFNKTHNFKLMVGYQQESFWTKWQTAYREVFVFDYPVLNAGGAENQKSSGSANDYAAQSVFGRFNYNFKEKYLFETNLRYDGSSRFAKGYRWGIFPSVSAGWRISEEDFWTDLKPIINNLKLRASYGKLGNQNISDNNYPSQSIVNLGTSYIFDKTATSGAAITTMANSIISWETTTQTNVGLDLNLFNKLELNAEYYYRRTDDILLNLNIPLIIGQAAPEQNAGSLENRGWELGVTYNDKFGDLKFSALFNISDVKNKILDLKGINQTSLTANREGYPMYSLYGYEADGYIVPEDYDSNGKYMGATQIGDFGPGDIKYKDQLTIDTNGDGIPDKADGVINTSDMVIFGSTIPRFTFGLGLFFEYKGFDLNMLFQGVGKADGYVWGHSLGSFYEGGSMPEIGKDYWTPENRNAMFPRLAFNNSNNQQNSSFWRKDASYIRMKNIQLGYTLPENLTSKIGISNLRLYVSTDNLFTITKFWKYFDVEAPVLTGYDQFYPIMRTSAIGLDIKF